MSKKKKWVLALLIPALLLGAVAGTYAILRANREPAKVYSVNEISEENYYFYENYLSGEVRTDRLQTVYPSYTQEITEVLVSVGDQVKKGDPLICFNTSLSELELERKALAIQKAQDELDKAQRTYRRYFGQNYVIPPVSSEQAPAQGTGLSAQFLPGVELTFLSSPVRLSDVDLDEPIVTETPEDLTEPTEPVTENEEPAEPTTEPPEPVTEPTEPVTEPTEPGTEPTEQIPVSTEPVTEPTEPDTEPVTEPTEPVTEPTENTEPTETTEPDEPGVVRTLAQVGGSGTPEDPALYIMGSDYSLTPEVLAELLGSRETVDLVLANTEEDRLEGLVSSAWGLTLVREETGWSVRFWDAASYLGQPLAPLPPEEPDVPDEPDFPDYPIGPIGPVGPSWQELQQLRKELEEQIRSLDLQIRMDQVTYRSMEAELGDGIIRAEFDGVVLTLNDADYSLETGEPMLKLSGGGGYKIVCSVSELQVENLTLGQTATVSDWYGNSYPAVLTEISQDPVKDYYDSYQNVSYYPATFEVDASADLGESYWVDVMLDSSSETRAEGFYLYKAFVLTENGKSYVLVRGENGLLEKRFLSTGRDMYGYMIEVLGGLSRSDYIAFPYAKSAEEGAKTEEGSVQELSGY